MHGKWLIWRTGRGRGKAYYKDRLVLVEAGRIKIVDAQNFKPKYVVRKVSGYPGANRREARKLGLLRMQKFRSRTRAIEAAGAQ